MGRSPDAEHVGFVLAALLARAPSNAEVEAAGGSDEDLTIDEAKAVITDDERFSDPDAEEALALLENHGYIYYVDEYVRITPSDE